MHSSDDFYGNHAEEPDSTPATGAGRKGAFASQAGGGKARQHPEHPGPGGGFYGGAGAGDPAPAPAKVQESDPEDDRKSDRRKRQRMARRIRTLAISVLLLVVAVLAVHLMLRMQQWGADRRQATPTDQVGVGSGAQVGTEDTVSAGADGESSGMGSARAQEATWADGSAAVAGWASQSAQDQVQRLKSAHSRAGMGIGAKAQGDWDGARRNLQAAVESAPWYATAQYELAMVHIHFADYPKALNCLRAALEADPNNAQYFLTAGQVFRMLAQHESAMVHIRRALDLDSEIPNGYMLMAMCMLEGGQGDRSIQYFRSALQRDPENTALWNNLGVALMGSGEVREAIRTFEETIRSYPDSTAAYQNLAIAHAQQDALEAAFEVLKSAGARFGGDTVLKWLQGPELAEVRASDGFLQLERELRAAPTAASLPL
ncbi:MAG: tetratricopeptide repeat protein [Verrucomicrobiota bacterium]|jgi:Tfp pilus assembly protein PilF